MDVVLLLLLLALALLSAGLGVLCIVQVAIGRQVFRPERSRRTPAQIRQDSAWAAGEYVAIAAAILAILAGSSALAVLFIGVGIASYVGLLLGRRGRRHADLASPAQPR